MKKRVLYKMMLYSLLFLLTSCGGDMNAEYLSSTALEANSGTAPGIDRCSVSSANNTEEDPIDSKGATPDLQTTDQLVEAKVVKETKIEQQKETEAKKEVVVVPAFFYQENENRDNSGLVKLT
jgi:hypothetical protein